MKTKVIDKKNIKTKSAVKGKLRENIEAIVIAVLLALLIRTFIVQAFKIPSGSMKETLQIGDHILVNKFIYGVKLPFINYKIVSVSDPKHGDIIVFKYPEDPDKDFIKRVVGLAGDTVYCRNKQVFVNNIPLKSEHVIYVTKNILSEEISVRDNFGPIKVPENSLFVMGDNRDNSLDSRFWGFVDLDAVRGKAFIIYWSWDRDNTGSVLNYVRWDRIAKLLK